MTGWAKVEEEIIMDFDSLMEIAEDKEAFEEAIKEYLVKQFKEQGIQMSKVNIGVEIVENENISPDVKGIKELRRYLDDIIKEISTKLEGD